MKLKISFVKFFVGLLLTTFAFGQASKPTEYFGIAGPILFDKVSYNLVWTSHPTDNYYKQEYLSKNDTLEQYKKLIMLEFITGKTKLKDIVASKVAELKKMKVSNPVINYETFEKDGEVMLDFIISENTADGKLVSILERNVYRYKSIVDKSGQKGVLLFGVSDRYYGNEIDDFFATFKSKRFDLINLVGAFKIPEI
ncbi:MAG TPA: hypothetical protein VLZ83_08940 [Edaphocola sp.]|nr:hypothetical protein [Edaphocola sp.]